MAGAVIVHSLINADLLKIPSLNWSSMGFTVLDTTDATLVILDIKGLNYIHCIIENVSAAPGAEDELDWGAIAYLHDSLTPSANSGITIIAADTTIATTAIGEFILGSNLVSVTGPIDPIAPAIMEVLPAARLEIKINAEGNTDTVTGNIWIQGNL